MSLYTTEKERENQYYLRLLKKMEVQKHDSNSTSKPEDGHLKKEKSKKEQSKNESKSSNGRGYFSEQFQDYQDYLKKMYKKEKEKGIASNSTKLAGNVTKPTSTKRLANTSSKKTTSTTLASVSHTLNSKISSLVDEKKLKSAHGSSEEEKNGNTSSSLFQKRGSSFDSNLSKNESSLPTGRENSSLSHPKNTDLIEEEMDYPPAASDELRQMEFRKVRAKAEELSIQVVFQ